MTRQTNRFLLFSLALLLIANLAVIAAIEWPRPHPVMTGTIPPIARNVLVGADQYGVFSIEPDMTHGGLDHYEILGRTTIVDAGTRAALNEALERTARESKDSMAQCFMPRHGIRATRAGVSTDLAICFECLHVAIYRDGEALGWFSTNKSAEPLFDHVLTQAGVRLAKKSE